ncbi:MAG: hypothetical protein V4696_07655 [Pseudomonadota bacterium]
MSAFNQMARDIAALDRAEQAVRDAREKALQSAQAYGRQAGHFGGFTLDAARRTLAFERGRQAA